MSKSRLRGRAALSCVVALACACAVACDSVLDIEDPMIRPPAGEGGEPSAGGTGSVTAGSATTSEGGGAGEGGSGGSAPMTAGAGSGGEGGDAVVTPPDCETDSVRCTGSTPEVCDEFGQWVQNETEASGECAVGCAEGRCVECLTEQKRCAVCEGGEPGCDANQPQICVGGAWKSEGASCKHYCDEGDCVTPPSCEQQHSARTTCQSGLSCCTALSVPGGTFIRDYDGGPDYFDDSFEATVSPFYLDKFEVTVGRMRQFVATYPDTGLTAGKGKAPHIADDAGYNPDLPLPVDKAALITMLKCEDQGGTTWSDDPILNNEKPVNCVSFAVASAFCLWDHGRLPTEAEWNFAAAGGSAQRAFPWFDEPTDIVSPDYANYGSTAVLPPGSKPMGDGRWGQSDLAGNVSEWTMDFYGDYPTVCDDCVNATSSQERVTRGGSYATDEYIAQVPVRSPIAPTAFRPFIGFRCARDSSKPGDN
ncbi:MAG: hypothetical protein EOO73_18105 [Myxococcales bacterium]|nr:MAG: hypothetical protein EOO73_18105 [Myxococcales bacterium]